MSRHERHDPSETSAAVLPLLTCATLLLGSASALAGGTLHVDANHHGCPGSGTPADPFCTIGAAVAAAVPGDTIEVAAGTYFESVVIDKDDLSLRGAGPDVTTIVGDPVSHVVGPAGLLSIPRFRIEGFRITTSDPGPGLISGVRADPQLAAGTQWHVDRCVIEGVDLGVQATNVFPGELLIENTVIVDCGAGVYVYGQGVTVRNCTLARLSTYGVGSDVGGSSYEIENTIIASTGWWAAMRSYLDSWSIRHVLVHANNLDNPSYAPQAGTFVEYLPEKGGIWFTVGPSPGPTSGGNPQFVDLGAGDVRLLGSSPAIDAGDPATLIDPGQPHDVLGFGHPRLDDGDFDGLAVVDVGAVEFGGLLVSKAVLAVGESLSLDQWGKGGALHGTFLGLPGGPLDLGPKGSLYLQPSPLIPLVTGVLPGGGTATVLSGTVPPAADGLTLSFQAVQKGPGPSDGLHWTNLEQVAIGP